MIDYRRSLPARAAKRRSHHGAPCGGHLAWPRRAPTPWAPATCSTLPTFRSQSSPSTSTRVDTGSCERKIRSRSNAFMACRFRMASGWTRVRISMSPTNNCESRSSLSIRAAFSRCRCQVRTGIGVSAPTAIAVAQDGTLYALNTSAKGANYVTVYAPKAGKPTLRLTKFAGSPTCLHVDASKNLYVGSVTASGTGALEEFAPGATVGTPISLQDLPVPTGIARDASGSFLITGTVSTQISQFSVVDLYQGSTPSGQGMPNTAVGVALTADESAMLLPISLSAAVYAYRYPLYQTSLAMLPMGLNTSVAGIAVSPADPN